MKEIEKKTRVVQQIYYVTSDGVEWNNEHDAINRQKFLNGERKLCKVCNGFKTTADEGNRFLVSCYHCQGRGYLERVEEWK